MNAIIFNVILKEISVICQQDLGFLIQSFEKIQIKRFWKWHLNKNNKDQALSDCMVDNHYMEIAQDAYNSRIRDYSSDRSPHLFFNQKLAVNENHIMLYLTPLSFGGGREEEG